MDMDKEFLQMEIVKCKQHPQFVISYLFCKKNRPYPSRLACAKCIIEYKTVEEFSVLLEVLYNPKVIITQCRKMVQRQVNSSLQYIYGLLNKYFHFLEQDPDDFIHFFKQDILEQIQKLEHDLKEGIEKYKKFKAEVAKVELQFNEALGGEQFRQAFKDILKVENYHSSQEWKKLEGTVQSFVLQFEEQQNQELNEAYYRLKQMQQKLQYLGDFKVNTSKAVELLCQRFKEIEVMILSSSLCDQFYCSELIQKISKNMNVQQTTLIFKASEHGMNAKSFWEKCNNYGPTIIFCKSKHGHVFGVYTPLKWISNKENQKDDSKTSFMFSCTRKEIYPITYGDCAIYCNLGYGPTFGDGYNLTINSDFKNGSSTMNGFYYSNEQYKIKNEQIHLMGGIQPKLVEMEVYLQK